MEIRRNAPEVKGSPAAEASAAAARRLALKARTNENIRRRQLRGPLTKSGAVRLATGYFDRHGPVEGADEQTVQAEKAP